MKKLQLLMVIVIFITGCSKEMGTPDIDQNIAEQTGVCEKLENPYSVSNMRKAYLLLTAQTRSEVGDLSPEEVVYPTHLYVVFKPKNLDEVDMMTMDTTINFFPYPLDYEISDDVVYREPNLPDDQPDYFYCAVPLGKTLTDEVEWKILEELFIPDEENDPTALTHYVSTLSQNFITQLVDKAMEITGNQESESTTTRGQSSWRPKGRISYIDEYYDTAGNLQTRTIGVEGLKVKATRWFTTCTGFVDADGYYSCSGTFKRPAKYFFDFTRGNFAVMSGKRTFPCAGSKRKGDYNFICSKSVNKYYHYYATVFRAAYHYCYKPIDGLSRPPQGSFWKGKIRLHAKWENNSDNGIFRSGQFLFFTAKTIYIYNPEKTVPQVYGTTIHELAHSAHWSMDRFAFKNVKDIICESWASGVELYLSEKIYPNYVRDYSRGDYTGIVEDLMDGVGLLKESYYYNRFKSTNYKSYIDNVTGYTIKQIENALRDAKKWSDWKNKLKKLDNATKDNLDAAFDYWSAY